MYSVFVLRIIYRVVKKHEVEQFSLMINFRLYDTIFQMIAMAETVKPMVNSSVES